MDSAIDNQIQDSTISSNSFIETISVKHEDEDDDNNNIEIKVYDRTGKFDRLNLEVDPCEPGNINLRANIHMIECPPIYQARRIADNNALNLVKVKKTDTVVEKSEATSTSNIPENYRPMDNNTLMQFIAMPLEFEEELHIDVMALYQNPDRLNVPFGNGVARNEEPRHQEGQENQEVQVVPEENEEPERQDIPEIENNNGPAVEEVRADADENRPTPPQAALGNAYICDICREPFDSRCCLQTHIFNIHNEGPSGSAEVPCSCLKYECKTCHEKFQNKTILQFHSQTHKITCQICDKKINKSHQKRHMLNHKRKKMHTCETCRKTFSERATLIRHEAVHTGDRPFKCDQCNKQFLEKGHLKTHLRIHNGDKPFQCQVCQKKFKQSGHLNEHKLTHNGKFSCDSCSKQFKTKAKLNSHKMTHERRNRN